MTSARDVLLRDDPVVARSDRVRVRRCSARVDRREVGVRARRVFRTHGEAAVVGIEVPEPAHVLVILDVVAEGVLSANRRPAAGTVSLRDAAETVAAADALDSTGPVRVGVPARRAGAHSRRVRRIPVPGRRFGYSG